jgi:hypothetical protein
MLGHDHAAAAKSHAFHLEPQPLLVSAVLSGFDLTAGADNALPRQTVT